MHASKDYFILHLHIHAKGMYDDAIYPVQTLFTAGERQQIKKKIGKLWFGQFIIL